MGTIYNQPNLSDFDYDMKLKTLLNNNIALWDTIKSCKREGSLDSDIQNETPNSFVVLRIEIVSKSDIMNIYGCKG